MRGSTPALREPPPPAVGASPSAERRARFLRWIGVTFMVALFLTATKAFGVKAPLAVLFGYWMVGLTICGLIAAPISWLFRKRGWMDMSPWICAPALTAAVAVPVVVFIWLFNAVSFRQRVDPRDLVSDILPCLVVSGCFVGLNMLIARRPRETHAAPAPASGDTPPRVRFLDRLPLKLRGADLHAVSAEDHYLRLHTSRGSDLILFRLADAIAELDGLEGAQTHRSWWVAKEAVTGARRGDGRAVLLLPGGVEAPVSRTYARALREEGWF